METKAEPKHLWSDWWALLPLVGAFSFFLVHVWALSYLLPSEHLRPLETYLRSLRYFPQSARLDGSLHLQVAMDAAGRLGWYPSLLVFATAALAAFFMCAHLLLGSYRDRVAHRTTPLVLGGFFLLGAGVLMLVLSEDVVRASVLNPLLFSAAGQTAEELATWSQRLFQYSAITVGTLVALAAAGALLTTAVDDLDYQAFFLAEQWRRLSFALFTGAGFLIGAVLYQAAMYTWPSHLFRSAEELSALNERSRQHALKDLANDDSWHQAIDSVIVGNAYRHNVSISGLNLRTAQAIWKRDSLSMVTGVANLKADLAVVEQVTTQSVIKAGGYLYSILLLVIYLPTAIVLVERARRLAILRNPDLKESDWNAWRTDRGIDFSARSDWAKVAAVLSPLLASAGATALFSLTGS